MRKTETLFISIALIVVIIVTGGAIWYACRDDNASRNYQYPTSQFGSFLAAQHAIYVNDLTVRQNRLFKQPNFYLIF